VRPADPPYPVDVIADRGFAACVPKNFLHRFKRKFAASGASLNQFKPLGQGHGNNLWKTNYLLFVPYCGIMKAKIMYALLRDIL
jgi:hypothetical protein